MRKEKEEEEEEEEWDVEENSVYLFSCLVEQLLGQNVGRVSLVSLQPLNTSLLHFCCLYRGRGQQ